MWVECKIDKAKSYWIYELKKRKLSDKKAKFRAGGKAIKRATWYIKQELSKLEKNSLMLNDRQIQMKNFKDKNGVESVNIEKIE